ncbi:MAG: hypothetical protein Q4G69_07285 [Planctomycetia bacterium]|nr:hypothetical protein [Planctomycetia bacterium]
MRSFAKFALVSFCILGTFFFCIGTVRSENTASEISSKIPADLAPALNLPEVLLCMNSSSGIRIGFCGSAGSGCRRAQTFLKDLRLAFPNKKIESFWIAFHDPDRALFRFDGDFLVQEPDLVVLDFYQGDPDHLARIREALVRKILRKDPGCGILFADPTGKKYIAPSRSESDGDLARASAFVPHQKMFSGTWFDDIPTGECRPLYTTLGVPVWASQVPGSCLTFRFRGTAVKIEDVLAPNGARLKIFLDGKEILTVDRFANSIKAGSFTIAEGIADSEHTVSIEILSSDSGRTFFRISRVLILGDLL